MKIHRFESLTSTNSYMAARADQLVHGDVVIAKTQTAGRGQRGNSWEAEPGKNLTFSIFLKPDNVPAADAFLLSMKVSVAIVDALNNILAPEKVKIKWPNDIYWNDLKLAGILIENSFSGTQIDHSIIGIGLNVNQKMFVSNAPNPVSMTQIAGHDFDLDTVLQKIVISIIKEVDTLIDTADLTVRYHDSLWRFGNLYLWHEPDGSEFLATIDNVAPTGHLTLKTPDGHKSSYAFKEVFPVI